MGPRRLAAAGLKVASKAAWTGWSALAPAPRTDSVFEQRVQETVLQRFVDMPDGSVEFVRRATGQLYIEPEWGYVISANGHLVEETAAPNFEYFLPTWRIGMPSVPRFMQVRSGRARTERHRSVISLRHPWEWNYFHFYLDVLGKLRLLDEQGIDPATPLVLGRYAYEFPFVQQVIQTGALKDRTWIVQDHSYVEADEIYYCRTKQPPRVKTDYLLDLMGVAEPGDTCNERVFLTRAVSASRHIVNIDEVTAVLRDHGFRAVDMAGWTIDQQIELFSKTRYLAGIHGAGFTNIMFRRAAPLTVLELHAESYRSRDFEDLCEQYGYGWDHLDGTPDDPALGQRASFTVDAGRLDRKIRQMLGSTETEP